MCLAIRVGHWASRLVLWVSFNRWELLLGGALHRLIVSIACLTDQCQYGAAPAQS
jgi:hypothetical protein